MICSTKCTKYVVYRMILRHTDTETASAAAAAVCCRVKVSRCFIMHRAARASGVLCMFVRRLE